MFTFYKQKDIADCGPTCLRMVIKHYKKNISSHTLKELCNSDREGTSIKSLENAAKKIGLQSISINSSAFYINDEIPVLGELPLPVIAHWNSNHFVVIYKISKGKAYVADPAVGLFSLPLNEIADHLDSENNYLKVVVFEPTPLFSDINNQYFNNQSFEINRAYIVKHIKYIKKGIGFLFIIILFKLISQSITPFLTQKTFDDGIIQKNVNILLVIFAVQLFIFVFNSFLNYYDDIISNKISQKINHSLTNDFIRKILKIPINVYLKNSSDFIYRINDLSKIESFLAYNFASFTLSSISIIVFSIILCFYNTKIFLIFLCYNVLYIFWFLYFLKKRKELNYEKFEIQVSAHQYLIEMVEGINEMKLNENNLNKVNIFATNQKKYYSNELLNIKRNQNVSIGSGLINSFGYNIIVLYTSYMTIHNTITIGEMAAIQLLISQLNSPISNIFSSIAVMQEMKYSLERILEIHSIQNESSGEKLLMSSAPIVLKNVSFSYTEISPKVIDKMNLKIEAGKTTAVVGLSGSGKTTLMKLVLGLYTPTEGNIYIDDLSIKQYNTSEWRKKCGVVVQDGYLFTDTIINNITEMDTELDFDKYISALQMASIYDFVMSLPIQHKTIIGKSGLSLSSGQRQRILIARMIYKDPDYIFMDEATNSLDTETEATILNNLENIFFKKTRLIIAHRLNTVINADKIIVLRNGVIVEEGSHLELIKNQGYYYGLVKEQLQLS